MTTTTKTEQKKPATRVLDRADQRPTLEQAQAFVGGYVEMLPHLGPTRHYEHVQILGNEDGIPLRLPVNVIASIYCGYEVRGNVLILKGGAKWE
jgi:hypothetical protein